MHSMNGDYPSPYCHGCFMFPYLVSNRIVHTRRPYLRVVVVYGAPTHGVLSYPLSGWTRILFFYILLHHRYFLIPYSDLLISHLCWFTRWLLLHGCHRKTFHITVIAVPSKGGQAAVLKVRVRRLFDLMSYVEFVIQVPTISRLSGRSNYNTGV